MSTTIVPNVEPLIQLTPTGVTGDPRRAQLIALFDMSDERGKVTLLAIAGIHAARYPKGGQ